MRGLKFAAALLAIVLACARYGAAGEPPAEGAGAFQAAADAERLSKPECERVQDLAAALAGSDPAGREKSEKALPAFGLAARALVEPLKDAPDAATQAAARRLLALPALAPDLPRARIVLARGVIELLLYEDDAPNTVANFIELAERRRFYDGLTFHRAVEQFMILGGDPTGTGRGGPGYRIADELCAEALGLDRRTAKELAELSGSPAPPKAIAGLTLRSIYEKQGYAYTAGLKSHPVTRGALATYGAHPNSSGSQFFIAQIDCPWLDGKHTVFGQVLRGMDVVDAVRSGEELRRVEVWRKRGHPYEARKSEEK